MGSCVNSKDINGCLAEIVCQSRISVGTVGEIVCVDLKIAFGLLVESNLEE